VFFDNGRVVQATIRSQTQAMNIAPRTSASTSKKERERQLRAQIETAVFELMSWREGFFSFEERQVSEVPIDAKIRISTESLLMEGARRIDEWSRIADKVSSLSAVPELAPVEGDRASVLDLLPHEWEVLMMIDGTRDLRGIAGSLGRSEFEIAKIAYGLVSTGVVVLRPPDRPSIPNLAAIRGSDSAIERAWACIAAGKPEEALTAARSALSMDATSSEAHRAAARAFVLLKRFPDAVEVLRRAVQADPLTPAVHLDLGFAAVRVGDFGNARASWEHFLRLAPAAPEAARVNAALETLTRMIHLVEAHVDV
jgi:Tfp pilus assembly protein PilF